MELFLLRPKDYELLYNCSFYAVDEIPLEKRQHPAIGAVYVILFFVFEVLYIPALWVMKDPQFMRQSCYKLMFAMGIADICCLIMNGFFTGLFSLLGYVGCSSPATIYWLGLEGMGFWVVQSDLSMVLAFNRCVELISPPTSKLLFHGRRTYYWISAAVTHAIFIDIFTIPVLYTGVRLSWYFDPHTAYREDVSNRYTNVPMEIHNMTVPIVLLSLYAIFMLLLLYKRIKLAAHGNRSSFSEKLTYVQVFTICVINGSASFFYINVQLFEAPSWLIALAHFFWFLAHGSPALVYLSLNQSIQQHLRRLFRRSTVSAISETSVFRQQQPIFDTGGFQED